MMRSMGPREIRQAYWVPGMDVNRIRNGSHLAGMVPIPRSCSASRSPYTLVRKATLNFGEKKVQKF